MRQPQGGIAIVVEAEICEKGMSISSCLESLETNTTVEVHTPVHCATAIRTESLIGSYPSSFEYIVLGVHVEEGGTNVSVQLLPRDVDLTSGNEDTSLFFASLEGVELDDELLSFEFFDTNSDRRLDIGEFREAWYVLYMEATMQLTLMEREGLSAETIRSMLDNQASEFKEQSDDMAGYFFDQYDLNGDGYVSLGEFPNGEVSPELSFTCSRAFSPPSLQSRARPKRA